MTEPAMQCEWQKRFRWDERGMVPTEETQMATFGDIGAWVHAEEYARLAAELERVKQERDGYADTAEHARSLQDERNALMTRNAALVALLQQTLDDDGCMSMKVREDARAALARSGGD